MITDKQIKEYVNRSQQVVPDLHFVAVQAVQSHESHNIHLIIITNYSRVFLQIINHQQLIYKQINTYFKIIFHKQLNINNESSIFYYKKINKRNIIVSRNQENNQININIIMKNNDFETV